MTQTQPPQQISDAERLAWLRLARTEHLSAAAADQLLARYPSAIEALATLPELVSKRRGGKRPVVPPEDMARAELDRINRHGAHLVVRGEARYPEILRQIDGAPIVLTVIGNPALLSRPGIGIVGSRNASVNGQRFAGEISRDLGQAGLTITSGLALGIDGRAHEAALATGTIAVLAGGANVIYPRQHTKLYEQIAEQGAIVSERPWGAEPMGKMFPHRNRIISGLSLGVVVVEAARRSGTLITATRAVEQNREVFAVPGFPYDPRSSGANHLLRQGAVLTETADDVLDVIRPMMADPAAALEKYRPDNFMQSDAPLFQSTARDIEDHDFIEETDSAPMSLEDDQIILNALSSSPTAVDELIRVCNLSAPKVATILTELELTGQVVRHPGNMVARVGSS